MIQKSAVTWLALATATLAQAHFVFVTPEPGGKAAKVFISETLAPDGSVDLALVARSQLKLRGADGKDTPLELTRSSDAYRVALANRGRLIHGFVDLGFTQRGESKPHLLLYYPKTILGAPFDVSTGGDTPVELVPIGKSGAVRLRLLTRGKPAANAEVTVILPDGEQKKTRTDAAGETEPFTQSGRYGAWARFWETAPGQRDGKTYEELRHYAMLVFDTPAASSNGSSAELVGKLPRAASSFGAVADGGYLYVYGGHVAPTHSYSTESVSGQFHRAKLTTPNVWEPLPGGPGLQGLNLAAHGGKIYRIGGMQPRNAPGAPSDNYSVADSARFHPATGKWEPLPPLPEPRSSHDVVVIGDTLLVAGGWNMKGKDGTKWAETLLSLDLAAAKPEWKGTPQPFRRRALIAAAHGGKLYVMGGIDDHGAVNGDVDIYDPKTRAWTKGPKLPGPGVNPFAPAACDHQGTLYVSLADGALYRLNEQTQQWETTGHATPRLAHRMVANGRSLLLIGGASGGHNLDLIESAPR